MLIKDKSYQWNWTVEFLKKYYDWFSEFCPQFWLTKTFNIREQEKNWNKKFGDFKFNKERSKRYFKNCHYFNKSFRTKSNLTFKIFSICPSLFTIQYITCGLWSSSMFPNFPARRQFQCCHSYKVVKGRRQKKK